MSSHPARSPFTPILSSALAVAIAAAGCAQAPLPVPAHAPEADGHESLALPFGLPGFRTQILVDASLLGPAGALITELRFRADRGSAPLPQVVVPNVTVDMSLCTLPVGGMTTTFASNITHAPTTVFQGSVTLPAQTQRFGEPQPFDIVIPIAAPFLIMNAAGNLLIDITGANPVGTTPTFYLDAMRAGGSATSYGEAGPNPSADTLRLNVSTGVSLSPERLAPGNLVEFNTMLSFTQPPGFFCAALDGLTTPFDLGLLGATGQTAYLAPLVQAPLAWQQSFIGYFATIGINVPNVQSLVGGRIYGQSFVVDPNANALGILTSPAVEVRIGDDQAAFPMQQLDAADPLASTGTIVDFAFGGPPAFGATPIMFEAVSF